MARLCQRHQSDHEETLPRLEESASPWYSQAQWLDQEDHRQAWVPGERDGHSWEDLGEYRESYFYSWWSNEQKGWGVKECISWVDSETGWPVEDTFWLHQIKK